MQLDTIREQDPVLYDILMKERRRQEESIELIASENFVSEGVMEAAGTWLTNKYAEGYPGARYYGGCLYVDEAENLARERLKELYGAEHVNVQPHSGSQANTAVYVAALEPGDTVLGMNLSHGGHLTHGSPVNISGKLYNFVPYGVSRETERLDYDEVRELARKHRPKMIVAGASAYPRIIDFARLREIADEVGAYLMVDMAHIAGLVAVGLHPSPVGIAEFVTSTTHKTLRGPRGGIILTTKEWGPKIDKAIFPGIQGGPLMHIVAAKAAAFGEALKPSFKEYQKRIVENASVLAKELEKAGLRLVSGGTDNHLMLVDVTPLGLTGAEAEDRLEKVGITVNKNTIPFDTKSPKVTSGIRIGTPAVTTRGMGPEAMVELAGLIKESLTGAGAGDGLRERVLDLCRRFPLFRD